MTFGFVFRAADGQVTLSDTSTGLRLVDAVALSHTFSGDIIVPEFDDTKGMFTLVRKVVFTTTEGVRLSPAGPNPNRFFVASSLLPQPALTWTQADTRLNVVAPAPVLQFTRPSGGANTVGMAPEYEVRFYHFR